MHNSKIQIKPHDRVLIKPLYKHPVPTAHEIKLLLDLYPDGSNIKIGLGFLFIEAMRPIEETRLRWPDFTTKDGKIITFRHTVYKPTNRRTKKGRNYYFKEVQKPIHQWSKWLNDQLIAYAKKSAYDGEYLFGWTTDDAINKAFVQARKQAQKGALGPEYSFLLDTNIRVVQGAGITRYRVSPYSLRRFAFTWHYYMTFQQDGIALARFFGHSRPETTLKHYVMPKEAIGLTQSMIDQSITIDQFIHLRGQAQMPLVAWTPEWEQRFTPAGQTSLKDFDQAFVKTCESWPCSHAGTSIAGTPINTL